MIDWSMCGGHRSGMFSIKYKWTVPGTFPALFSKDALACGFFFLLRWTPVLPVRALKSTTVTACGERWR
jgi:hypothetical protein